MSEPKTENVKFQKEIIQKFKDAWQGKQTKQSEFFQDLTMNC